MTTKSFKTNVSKSSKMSGRSPAVQNVFESRRIEGSTLPTSERTIENQMCERLLRRGATEGDEHNQLERYRGTRRTWPMEPRLIQELTTRLEPLPFGLHTVRRRPIHQRCHH